MSYDLNFWKQQRPLAMSAEDVYGQLSSGEAVEGLATLPLDKILSDLREAFPSFEPEEEWGDISLDDGSIEVSWSNQHFRFDLRGEIGAEHQNRLVRIMAEHGCPLYDPQVEKRYDADGGVGLGEIPTFSDPTPEQQAEIERLKRQVMSQFENSSGLGGCRRNALLLMLSVAAAITIILKT